MRIPSGFKGSNVKKEAEYPDLFMLRSRSGSLISEVRFRTCSREVVANRNLQAADV